MKHFLRFAIFSIGLFVIAACGRADFAISADKTSVEQALTDAGIETCVAMPLAWNTVGGFVDGTYYELNDDCAEHDPNHPGVRLWIAHFDRVETRNAAALAAEGTRRHLGSGGIWTAGPLLIAMDGHHDREVASTVRQALATVGAQ